VEGPWALPEGWRWERLGQIVPLTYGKALKASERDGTGSVPVYGSSGPVGLHTEALCTEPALIVGRKGAAGCVHFCDGPSYAIDTAYFAPSSKLRVDIRLANHLLNHLQLSSLDQSTAVPSLSRDTYNDVVAPVPPKELQGPLAAKIDSLFAEVAAGEEALGLAGLGHWQPGRTLRQSILAAAFRGELAA
jgi:type I restriction enzyme S subunit